MSPSPAYLKSPALSSAASIAGGSPRIAWVDIYKGLAIFMVVIGHSHSPLAGLVYTFHLSAFFFISGYTTRLEGVSLHPVTAQFLQKPFTPDFFEHAVNQLFVEFSAPTDFGGATWFLPCLLSTAVLARFWTWIGEHTLVILCLYFVAFRLCFIFLHSIGLAGTARLGQLVPGDQIACYWLAIAFVSIITPIFLSMPFRRSRIFLAK